MKWLDVQLAEKQQWTERHFSLRFHAPGFRFTAGQFVRVGLLQPDGDVLARPYSLVNPPDSELLEIYFNIVPEGPLTPQLAALQPGDTLRLAPRAAGFLTLDEIPFEQTGCKHLWMLATGTGVGPFLSILQTDEAWRRFEKLVLVYSVRIQQELAYRHLIEQLVQQHPQQFHFVPAVTREIMPGALTTRITSALESGELEQRVGLSITPQQSHVMMCGNSAMIRSAFSLLEQHGLRKHLRREPGHISTEKYH